MTTIVESSRSSWTEGEPDEGRLDVARVLERGDVLWFPRLSFPITSDESALFTPSILSSAKNASFDPRSGQVGGTTLGGDDRGRLSGLMRRFSDLANRCAASLLPMYAGRLQRARASFRPAEIASRASSWRKDDTRLHVDSFPASPVQGRRILRVFANVNPSGRARPWRVGGDFESLARRFLPALSLPWPGSGRVLQAVGLTKSLRTPYDALMLQLHDQMKQDAAYQVDQPQHRVDFPAGSAWMAFTDQVSHAAISGQYQLEHTFLLPVDAMVEPETAPLRILERLTDRRLA